MTSQYLIICLAWNIYPFPYPYPKMSRGTDFFHSLRQVTIKRELSRAAEAGGTVAVVSKA